MIKKALTVDQLKEIRDAFIQIQLLNEHIESINKKLALGIKRDLKASIRHINQRIAKELNL